MPFDPNDPDTKAALKAAVDEALEPLVAKRDELLGEVRKLKRGQQVDPADVDKLHEQIDTLKADAIKQAKDLKAAQTAAAKATEDYTRSEGERTRMLVDNGLTEALAKVGVTNPVHQKAARAMLGSQVQVVEGAVRVGDKPLADYVAEWSKGDEGKFFVAAPSNNGGGAQGGGGSGGAHADLQAIKDPGARMQEARRRGITT